MATVRERNIIHVDVRIKKNRFAPAYLEAKLGGPLKEYFKRIRVFPLDKTIPVDFRAATQISVDLVSVESVLFESEAEGKTDFDYEEDIQNLLFHIYFPTSREMELESLDEGGEGDGVPSSGHWLLPSTAFESLWENLIYDGGLKERLLRFALSSLKFSQHSVNVNVISCNRLILVYGPPGTGKTSLCKALAQKLSIRTQPAYRHTHLIEINSHSLFSKWFSESGKLVMRLFGKIREIVADTHNLVCVLIDEVESLAYSRDSMSGEEPKDAIRVVNALLTQLDGIKDYPNVLIMATSNIVNNIDVAFVDRADIKQYVELPSMGAIRRIYETMLHEMMRAGFLREESLSEDDPHEGLLSALTECSVGLSGRTLRKLPFLAHSVLASSVQFNSDHTIALSDFLDAMLDALEKHRHDQDLLKT